MSETAQVELESERAYPLVVGFPLPFNNNWYNRGSAYAKGEAVLAEPFIGGGHGFVKVSRLRGRGLHSSTFQLNLSRV